MAAGQCMFVRNRDEFLSEGGLSRLKASMVGDESVRAEWCMRGATRVDVCGGMVGWDCLVKLGWRRDSVAAVAPLAGA
jgi:hypothetical protein